MQANEVRRPTRREMIEEIAMKVKRVALVILILALGNNILLLVCGYSVSIGSLVMSVLVPYCGFEGARKRQRALLNCFWGCNAGGVFVFATNVALLLGLWRASSSLTYLQQDSSRGVAITSITISALTAVAQFLGCLWGRQLSMSEELFLMHDPHMWRAAGEPPHRRALAQPGAYIDPYTGAIRIVTVVANNGGPPHLEEVTLQRRQLEGGAAAFGGPGGTTAVLPGGVPEPLRRSFPVRELLAGEVGSDAWGNGATCCVICQDDLEAGHRLKTLPCKHHYHSHCIDRWLLSKKTCPICNYVMV